MIADYAVQGGIDAVAFFGGMAYGMHRRKPPSIDVAVAHPACTACGGEWGPWSATEWMKQAERFEQSRTCRECGLTQRRKVPR